MLISRNIVEFIFSSALFINALLFVPQIIKILKEKNAIGVSLITFIGFLLIQLATVLHGVINHDYLLVTGYILSMITCGTVITISLIYKSKKPGDLNNKISLEEIIEQLPGHVYWKNLKGCILGSNTNNWKDFGKNSLSEFLGKTDYEIFPKEQADKLWEIDQKVIKTGKPQIIEEVCSTINKGDVLYLSHKVPLLDSNKNIIGVLGLSLDITDGRKKEIERLEFLEYVISLMPGHVYWKDKNGVYSGCNLLQAKSAGLTSIKEIVGKTDYEMPWKEQATILRKVDLEVMQTGIAVTAEEPSTLADGTEAIFLSKKVPLHYNGEVVGILGISFDITEQRKIEKELKETRSKLEGMTLASATVAHELRTPLASLNVAADTIKKIFPDFLEAYQLAKQANLPVREFRQQYLDALKESLITFGSEINAAFTFIDMMLMKVNPSSHTSTTEIFSIFDCINETLLRYPFDLDQRQLVEWEPSNNQDFSVRGEKLLIIHVLFNLMKNALYYVAVAGKRNYVGSIKIWLEQSNIFNHLYFKDMGTGISKEALPHIFDRFYTNTYHGTGVGLSFCKMVMESLDGQISCESEEGRYTLFTLSFPKY